MYALLDCESFYASCERVFRPDLVDRPIAVLSNNDGCIIALSKELKEMGMSIGTPYFKNRSILKQRNVAVFSANFPLYGDISARVMHCLRLHAQNVEVYSIDEAFFKLPKDTTSQSDPGSYIDWLRELVIRWNGVPVRIGLGATKTLGKAANYLAKRCPGGTCCLLDEKSVREALAQMPAIAVWGIGRRMAKRLREFGVETALDFRNLSPRLIKKELSITGLRTQRELHGEPCLEIREIANPKSLIHSRTFPCEVFSLAQLQRHLREFAARIAARLRQHGLQAGTVEVGLSTNRHGSGDYQRSHALGNLQMHSCDTLVIADCAAQLAAQLYRSGNAYKRAGITLLDLAESFQGGLDFDATASPERRQLWSAVDILNERYGRDTVRCGWGDWKPRQQKLSPCYTTRKEELREVY